MEARVVEFVEVLRQNGLKVALSEAKDAVRALAEIGVDEREVTRATLKATLCKRSRDAATFDKAFDFYFSAAAKTLGGLEGPLSELVLSAEDRRVLEKSLQERELHDLTRAALDADRARLAQIFREAARQLDYARIQNALQTGFFGRRLVVAAGAESMRSDIEGLARSMSGGGMSARAQELVNEHLAQSLRRIEDAARVEVRRQSDARLKKPSIGVEDKALHTLTKQEVDVAQRAVRALAEKLKARMLRRQRSKRRGQLNPRKTLRANLTSGGVPMVPYFKTRRPKRPDVVVLCDVSDSVRNASRLMLLFTWSLQSLFTRVRSFIFVADTGEVTSHFKGVKPEVAIDAALQSGVISINTNSNYGQSLVTFVRGQLGSITRRTTVFIIGDGRNNRNDPQVWALEDLKRKAKRVIWICNEPKPNWNFGDSEMNAYSRAVSQVVTVTSLAELEKIAPKLVPL
ncbi:MAG: hypothetical protein DI536_03580 [Archangium gephyra]|uniref:VWA domain-containing protein n=1 Tax=Archangium gephyra TaxID=48 RepID=A0A2W5TYM6_9BACT|nr:MAG: hypothetical protein DI536_03580 [Archangium gephyra]